jgi:hypothetical protein
MGVHIEMGKKHGAFSLFVKQGFQFSDDMGDGFMAGCCACLSDHGFIDAGMCRLSRSDPKNVSGYFTY